MLKTTLIITLLVNISFASGTAKLPNAAFKYAKLAYDTGVFDFNISPNPAKTEVEIDFSIALRGTLLIHDSAGNEVYRRPLENEKILKLQLQGLNAGIYFISAKTNQKTVIKRLIKY